MLQRVQNILNLIRQLEVNEREELFNSTPKLIEQLPYLKKKQKESKRTKEQDANIICPRCRSKKYRQYGQYRGSKRYLCRSCSRTFTELTNSPIARTRLLDKWDDFIGCMVEGKSLPETAQKIDISVPTAFAWRHKILEKYEKKANMHFEGIMEADETFFLFSEKGNKGVSKRRKPRQRGGKASMRGISNEQVPVIAGCDRSGNVILGVADRGRISMSDIETVLNDRIGSNVTLCTDAHQSFKAYAKSYKLSYVGLNISRGRRIVKKKYHIQNVNSFHSRLKLWMGRFKGVSTKYLQNYMNWFALLEETKNLPESQRVEFIRRSVPSIL